MKRESWLAKTLILLTLIGGGILFGNYILAGTEVTGGCCDTLLVFNSPHPNAKYTVGDTINFSGKFKVTGCGNGLFFNKITFYITENRDIPITDCCGHTSDNCDLPKTCECELGCINCYGAKSSSYSSCDFQWCDEVKYLDTTKGYKIYKLGTIYPSDVGAGAKPYWVEYNQNFVIPENLGFSGPVRFYVQYSGTHWDAHWHWNITYQKGYINSPPNPPTADGVDGVIWIGGCDYTMAIPTFHWIYSDDDNDPPGTDPQTAYQIRVRASSNFPIDGQGNPILQPDEFKCNGQVCSGGSFPSFSPAVNDWINWVSFGTTYYWTVRVKDGHDWSSWMTPVSFSTPLHTYPRLDFEWFPPEPTQGEVVQFCSVYKEVIIPCDEPPCPIKVICPEDKSICYDINNDPISCSGGVFVWTMPGVEGTDYEFVNGTNSNSENPKVKFLTTTGGNVTLKITDKGDCGSCSKTHSVGITLPLPEYREVPPIIWLKKFLAMVSDFLNGFLKFQ